ncbi:hypothetical protein COW81_02795 [Candidatus Campbellbacteria bacterium CG22_combo_CG10-13_8_21_14_all_36_13]|uniref:Uncharacterized protein n=1 Tax=Candidatus Campbellbacteria bacterium CG22_combo_CG10-13_8_21_14_all_36_13 TaxID=1974529 RepID=A0A2H0DZ42_9BACT|nr:MAG: hypothetical protein COW81_02795 [Candidatus Campbellbacteria bacterium CG22_combo_CG10-13_8_21_14_all_36_13]
MSKFSYFYFSSFIFFFAGLLHLYRALNGFELSIGPLSIPVWMSWVLVLITGIMVYFSVKFRK